MHVEVSSFVKSSWKLLSKDKKSNTLKVRSAGSDFCRHNSSTKCNPIYLELMEREKERIMGKNQMLRERERETIGINTRSS